MKKKRLVLKMSLILALSLIACGGKKEDDTSMKKSDAPTESSTIQLAATEASTTPMLEAAKPVEQEEPEVEEEPEPETENMENMIPVPEGTYARYLTDGWNGGEYDFITKTVIIDKLNDDRYPYDLFSPNINDACFEPFCMTVDYSVDENTNELIMDFTIEPIDNAPENADVISFAEASDLFGFPQYFGKEAILPAQANELTFNPQWPRIYKNVTNGSYAGYIYDADRINLELIGMREGNNHNIEFNTDYTELNEFYGKHQRTYFLYMNKPADPKNNTEPTNFIGTLYTEVNNLGYWSKYEDVPPEEVKTILQNMADSITLETLKNIKIGGILPFATALPQENVITACGGTAESWKSDGEAVYRYIVDKYGITD